jgi:hypothetical protein
MKLLTTLLVAVLASLAVYSARRRIVFALKTGAIVYVVLLFGRLLISAGSLADRWEDLFWPVVVMLIAWVILWSASTVYAERRHGKIPAKTASGVGRQGR